MELAAQNKVKYMLTHVACTALGIWHRSCMHMLCEEEYQRGCQQPLGQL